MNNHKRSRRNRPMDTGRSHQGTRRPTGQQNSVSASQTLHGLYSDQRCCHSVSVMTGCTVQVSVKKGLLYEGVLVTVSPDKQFVLEAVHVVEKKTSEVTGPSVPSEMIDKIIFQFKDIVYVKAKDCDIEYAVKGDSFLTDTEISDRNRGINGQTVERELEEWTVDAEDAKIDHSLEGSSDMANGWSAEDMFKTNQEKFAVQTVYDESLADYTTQLDKEDTKEYRDRKDRAERLAREIEASPDHARNAALESSDGDEEQKYSSVVRPGYAGHGQNNNKYIPPHLRSHSGGSNPSNQPPRLRSPQNRQMHNTSQMSRPQSRTPPQAHSPQPPQHHQVHPPPHHMMQQPGHPGMRHPHPHAHPPPPHPSQLQLHRSPNQGGPPPQHISPHQQRLPPPQHIPHLTGPRSPQQQGMHPGHLRAPPQSIPHPQMSPRQQPPPPQEHRGSPVSPIQLKHTMADVIREENKPYVDSSESSKTLNSTSRKTPSSPQPAASADSIPTSPGAPIESSTENPSKVPEDKNVAELKEFSRNFHLSDSTAAPSTEPKATTSPNNLASKPSPNSNITSVGSSSPATPTTPSDAQSVDKTRTATEALEKKESEPEKSDTVKKYTLNPNAKEFNPNAKPFVPSKVLSHPTKTPTPPRPQSQPSPVLVQHGPGPMQSFIMVPPVNPQKIQQFVKKASNMPQHQRQQQPDIPHGIPVSVAAGQPIITHHMGFQPGGQIMYPVQQGGQTPQGMGPPVIPQPQPYQPYQPPLPYTKQPPMYRQVTPQANIPNAAPHQGAQGIQQVQEGNHPQVHVVSNQAALQAQHQAAVAMQQAQQQQQQQQQQHYAHQQIQQHQQAAPHLQPQTHPHAQPNNTPPQQGQHTQQNQPSGPTMQQQQQGQQHTGRPSPSPVHHMPQQMTHMTQAQMQHPHASQQAQLLYQSSLQPVTSQQVPGQQLQSPQSLHPQHPFSGTHPTQLQLHYPPSSNIQAPNITSVTPVHSHPHPHPQQAGVFYIQNPNQAGQAGGGQAGMQYPSVSGAGQHMTGPYLQAAQGNNKYWSGPGQPQQPVQYQQGN